MGRNLGFVLSTTLSLWSWKKGSSKVSAWSSLTHLTKVIAIKKDIFQDKYWSWQECSGLNGGPMNLISTMLRFHASAGGSVGGITLLSHSMNALMTGILNKDICCLFCR